MLNNPLGRLFLIYPTVVVGGLALTALGFALTALMLLPIIYLFFIFGGEILVVKEAPVTLSVGFLFLWLITATLFELTNRYIARRFYLPESKALWGRVASIWFGLGVLALLFSIFIKNKAPEEVKEKTIKRHYRWCHSAVIAAVFAWISLALIWFL